MLRSILIILAVIPVFFAGSTVLGDNLPFKVGEYLEFEVKLFNIAVAVQKTKIISRTNYQGNEVFHINSDIETMPWVSKIYHMHDVIDSYIDTKTLVPLMINTKIKEGNWTNSVSVEIKPSEHKLHYRDKRTDTVITYEGNILGLDSLIYYVRLMKLKVGDKNRFTLSNGDKVMYINTVITKTEKLKVKPLNPKKEINTIVVQQEGAQSNVAVWFTLDENMIPVRMVSMELKLAGYGITKIEGWLVKYNAGL